MSPPGGIPAKWARRAFCGLVFHTETTEGTEGGQSRGRVTRGAGVRWRAGEMNGWNDGAGERRRPLGKISPCSPWSPCEEPKRDRRPPRHRSLARSPEDPKNEEARCGGLVRGREKCPSSRGPPVFRPRGSVLFDPDGGIGGRSVSPPGGIPANWPRACVPRSGFSHGEHGGHGETPGARSCFSRSRGSSASG